MSQWPGSGMKEPGKNVAGPSRRASSHSIHTRGLSGPTTPRAGIAGGVSSLTGKPSAIHFAIPPSRGWTRVIPRRLSRSATRALVASLGQEQ